MNPSSWPALSGPERCRNVKPRSCLTRSRGRHARPAARCPPRPRAGRRPGPRPLEQRRLLLRRTGRCGFREWTTPNTDAHLVSGGLCTVAGCRAVVVPADPVAAVRRRSGGRSPCRCGWAASALLPRGAGVEGASRRGISRWSVGACSGRASRIARVPTVERDRQTCVDRAATLAPAAGDALRAAGVVHRTSGRRQGRDGQGGEHERRPEHRGRRYERDTIYVTSVASACEHG